MVSGLRYDQHRTALGFLTVAEADALTDAGVRVLDPFSAMISAGVLTYPAVSSRKPTSCRVQVLPSGSAKPAKLA
jgi:2-keto-3-deoxy-6-phosphogluconate aldolase